jgi:hypothetical protein
MTARRTDRFAWVAEPFAAESGHLERALFGCRAHYLDGRLVLVRAERGAEPWQGLLFPTGREQHLPLIRDFPALGPHPVLGKWLYLAEADPDFEATALALGARIQARDPRLGVEPEGERGAHPLRAAVTRRGGSGRRR